MCCRFCNRNSSCAGCSTLLRSRSTSALVKGEADFPAPMCLSVFTIMLPYHGGLLRVFMVSLATVYLIDAEEAFIERKTSARQTFFRHEDCPNMSSIVDLPHF